MYKRAIALRTSPVKATNPPAPYIWYGFDDEGMGKSHMLRVPDPAADTEICIFCRCNSTFPSSLELGVVFKQSTSRLDVGSTHSIVHIDCKGCLVRG
jgi:hypothetical protein